MVIRRSLIPWRKLALFVATLALLIVPLTACYDLSEEVIPGPQGDINPYRPSDATMDDGGHMYFSPAGSYNDVRYRQVDKDGTVSTGTFRLLHITADIYAVQVKEDSGGLELLFYGITSNEFHGVTFADGNAAKSLASRYNVKLDPDAETIEGNASDIFSFLRAANSLDFKNT